ncbi:MAG: deoxyribonuclease IV [Planctomycetes bacterium]|nr:deoxyribonuclease IV [Planctomycetota bacterium]
MKHDLTANRADSAKPGLPKTARPLFGAHLSVAGGFENAFAAGVRVGCDCLQIFVRNQRRWQAPPLAPEHLARFRRAARDTGLAPIVAHASYLLNLAAPRRFVRDASVAALADELERCEALGVAALIFHPGAHLEGTMQQGIARIAKSLNEVTRRTAGQRTFILLETTAGQGTSVGWRFEQLAAIRDALVSPERVGVCLDTCHLLAAGYDIRTPGAYAAVMQELATIIGLAHVRCIHVNDSKKPLGSRVDRHEHIGKGAVGRRGFANFVNDRRWAGIPMILETPKGVDGRGTDLDRVNLQRLRKLLAPRGAEAEG